MTDPDHNPAYDAKYTDELIKARNAIENAGLSGLIAWLQRPWSTASLDRQGAAVITELLLERDRLREREAYISGLHEREQADNIARAEAAEAERDKLAKIVKDDTGNIVGYLLLEIKTTEVERTNLAMALTDIIHAHDSNSGAEPSVSVLGRAIDHARDLLKL